MSIKDSNLKYKTSYWAGRLLNRTDVDNYEIAIEIVEAMKLAKAHNCEKHKKKIEDDTQPVDYYCTECGDAW